MRKRVVVYSMIGIGLVAFAYAWFASVMSAVGKTYKFPVEAKILDCNEQDESVEFTVPDQTAYYSLLLGFSARPASLSGKVHWVQSTGATLTMDFATTTSQTCNWLDGEGAVGKIILPPRALPQLQTGTRMHLNVQFDQTPSEGVSLWLCAMHTLDTSTGDPQKEFLDQLAIVDVSEL